MAWLLRDDEVLASLEIADSRASRRRGLLGRDALQGALWLAPARAVHTVGMRFDIDVAFLDADGVVLDVCQMRRHRIGLPRWRARVVVETEAGALERWGVVAGQRLEVKGA